MSPSSGTGRRGGEGPRLRRALDVPGGGDSFAGVAAPRGVKPDRDARAQEAVQDRVAILQARGDESPGQRVLVGRRLQAVQALALLARADAPRGAQGVGCDEGALAVVDGVEMMPAVRADLVQRDDHRRECTGPPRKTEASSAGRPRLLAAAGKAVQVPRARRDGNLEYTI